MIKKIYAVWVKVKDIERSRQFYENMLGMKFKLRNSNWVEFDLGETSFAILEKKDSEITPMKTQIMLEVDDISQMVKELELNGVKIIKTQKKAYGTYVTFEDPDGHWLELYQPK